MPGKLLWRVALAGAILLGVLVLGLPSLAHAVSRNRMGLELTGELAHSAVPRTICPVVLANPAVIGPDCGDARECYLRRVRANLGGQWTENTPRARGDELLSAYQNGLAAWCEHVPAEAVSRWAPFTDTFAGEFVDEGDSALAKQEIDAAFEWFTAANTLKPSAEASAGLGEVYRERDEPGKAMEAYDVAIARGLEDTEIYRNAALVALQEKEFARAQAYCERAMAFSQGDWRLWQLYGNALGGQELWSRAEQAYRRVVELNPTFAAGNAGLGLALARQGKFEQARPVYMSVLAYETADVQKAGYVGLYASLLAKAGDHAQALEFFRYAADFDPNNRGFVGSLLKEFVATHDCEGMTQWLAQRQQKGLPVPASVPRCSHE